MTPAVTDVKCKTPDASKAAATSVDGAISAYGTARSTIKDEPLSPEEPARRLQGGQLKSRWGEES